MTSNQKQALDYIRQYWKQHGYSPSYRDVSIGTGKALSYTHKAVDVLHERGFIHVVRKRVRSIYPVDVWHELRDRNGAEIEKTQ
jgi:SOS-response transcriptional repressor LexA